MLCIYKKSHLTAIILSTIFIINIIFAYIPYINDFKPIIIPESYFNIQKILNNKSIDASVMLVPVSSWVNSYSWTNNSNRGAISEPLKYFSDKSLNFNQVSYLKDNNETANEQIVNYLLTGYPTESAELISSRNIKFIITKNDILPKQNLSINNQVSNELQLTPMYVDNNTISLYEINSKLVYTPIIYLADNNRKTSIVYKKINPTKYRILINNITNTSNLVFSDSFSNRWKIYLNNNQNINIDGSKYISENYKGTIQNDNLNDGLPWETWQSKPVVNEDNHSMVNGFANKWSIDIKKICSNNNACIMNKDGSYNISIILEYDTQKYYFIGLLVSGISLAISLLYVIYYSLRKLMAKYHSVHRDNSIKVK